MRNIQIWRRETDRSLLLVLACAISAGVGFALPTPYGNWLVKVLDSVIILCGWTFAWGVFRLCEPKRFSPGWAELRALGIPALWVVVVSALAVWLYHLHATQGNILDHFMNQLVTQIA